MRIAIALLSLLLLGCAPRHARTSLNSPLAVNVSDRTLDVPPRLLTCAVSPNALLAGAPAYLTVPVRFTVTPEGIVDPGSTQVTGPVRLHERTTNEGDAMRRLRAHEAAARTAAQRNVETCTFSPAERDGKRVAVTMQRTFFYAE
jgi:hypothetical protein